MLKDSKEFDDNYLLDTEKFFKSLKKNARFPWIRFALSKSPEFQGILPLFSGPEYPNTFGPGLRGYFVTISTSGQVGPKLPGNLNFIFVIVETGFKWYNNHKDSEGGLCYAENDYPHG